MALQRRARAGPRALCAIDARAREHDERTRQAREVVDCTGADVAEAGIARAIPPIQPGIDSDRAVADVSERPARCLPAAGTQGRSSRRRTCIRRASAVPRAASDRSWQCNAAGPCEFGRSIRIDHLHMQQRIDFVARGDAGLRAGARAGDGRSRAGEA